MSLEHPDLGACSDEELVARLVAGEKQAMEVIFERYYALLMRVALRILRDRGEAEDAVQVALTDFYRTAEKFSPGKGRLSTWLLQYIYGRSLNRRKALQSRRHFDHVEYTEAEPWALAESSESAFRLSGPEARRFAEQALERLNRKQRRAVELICFAGLTLQEAAQATGETAGNLQHHYYRGLEKLRREMTSSKGQVEGDAEHGGQKKVVSSLRGEVENAKAQTF